MSNKTKKYLIVSIILAVVTLVFTFLVTKVDVKPIGPFESEVGFAGMNKAFFDMTGTNTVWFDVAKILGYVAIAVVGLFGLMGLFELITRKSLLKVDEDILVLGGIYALTMITYVFFEKVIINYRPVVFEEGLEASFPSSHTLLSIVVFATAILNLWGRLKKMEYRVGMTTVFATLGVLIILGRMLSGAHWLTDIIGAVFYGATYVMIYVFVVSLVRDIKKQKR